jgi:hypothetical protein
VDALVAALRNDTTSEALHRQVNERLAEACARMPAIM